MAKTVEIKVALTNQPDDVDVLKIIDIIHPAVDDALAADGYLGVQLTAITDEKTGG